MNNIDYNFEIKCVSIEKIILDFKINLVEFECFIKFIKHKKRLNKKKVKIINML